MVILLGFILPHRDVQVDEGMIKVLFVVCLAMLVVMVPAGYGVRALIYGKRRPDGTIPVARYSSGNIILWALCEAVAFFALVCVMLDGKMSPFLWLALIAMANQAANFPTGGRVRACYGLSTPQFQFPKTSGRPG